jgi:hypothetical protein
VCKLKASFGSLGVNEVNDPAPAISLSVIPNAGALAGDSAFRANPGCFHHHEANTTSGILSCVDKVPIVWKSIVIEAGILAHWRNPETVSKRCAANR